MTGRITDKKRLYAGVIESTFSVVAEAQERAIWESSVTRIGILPMTRLRWLAFVGAMMLTLVGAGAGALVVALGSFTMSSGPPAGQPNPAVIV